MTVRIERAGNRILLVSGTPTPGLKAQIPGAYWRDKGQCWSVPLDLTTCHLLRERFGSRLVIGPALRKWAVTEKARRANAVSTAAASDATLRRLPEVAPRLFSAMDTRTYQRAGVRFIADAEGRDGRLRALLGDTVGLGKTAQAIGAVLESGAEGPYLINAPKGAARLVWAPEIRKWLGADANVITLPEGKAARTAILDGMLNLYRMNQEDDARGVQKLASLDRTWLITHPVVVRTQTWWICALCGYKTKYKAGMVDELDCGHEKERTTTVEHEHAFPQLFEMEYGAVIADESDQVLIRKTATPNLQRRGMEMLRDRVRPGGLRLALSGTPFRSKPHQIWSTLNWLDPIRWSAKWSFLEKYWTVFKGGYGGSYSIGDMREDREDLLAGDLADVMIRRTREQVRGDLPPKLYPSNVAEDSGLTPGIYLPMTPGQERAYLQMEKTGSASLEGGDLNAIGVLAELTRLKQFAGAPGVLDGAGVFEPKAAGNKYEWLLEFLQELGFPDRPSTKVVVASQFTQLLNAFAFGVEKDLKLKPNRTALVTGEVTGPRREGAVNRFEDLEDPLDLLWINTKAGGSAITLDAADVMVVLDETWVDDEQQQLEGRIDNRQPERRIAPRSYYYLRSLGTLEEGIAAANAEARALGKRILDGGAVAKRVKEFTRR